MQIGEAGPLSADWQERFNGILPLCWHIADDTPRLVAEVLASVHSGPRRNSPRKTPVGGLPTDSVYYIHRPVEDIFYETMKRRESTILVRGTRQMGKTSLLARGAQFARDQQWQGIYTNLERLSSPAVQSSTQFYRELAGWIAEDQQVDVQLDNFFSPRDPANINFNRFMRRFVLDPAVEHTVWCIDEVDRLFDCPFRSEAFGLLRSWHNAHTDPTENTWNRLTVVLAYATEAYLFVTDLNQSPFNTGTLVSLHDFSLEEVARLNHIYGEPLRTAEELKRFHRLLGGHPYLSHHAMFVMSEHGLALAALEENAFRNDGIFGDHLRRILLVLSKKPEHLAAVKIALRKNQRRRACRVARFARVLLPFRSESLSVDVFYRLRAAGILAGDAPHDASVRCELYDRYLRNNL